VIWRLQNFAADGSLLAGRARRALDIDIALRVSSHENVTCIVHFDFDALGRMIKIESEMFE
jgi:hypothetical protein